MNSEKQKRSLGETAFLIFLILVAASYLAYLLYRYR
jgi:hypothetical protein